MSLFFPRLWQFYTSSLLNVLWHLVMCLSPRFFIPFSACDSVPLYRSLQFCMESSYLSTLTLVARSNLTMAFAKAWIWRKAWTFHRKFELVLKFEDAPLSPPSSSSSPYLLVFLVFFIFLFLRLAAACLLFFIAWNPHHFNKIAFYFNLLTNLFFSLLFDFPVHALFSIFLTPCLVLLYFVSFSIFFSIKSSPLFKSTLFIFQDKFDDNKLFLLD